MIRATLALLLLAQPALALPDLSPPGGRVAASDSSPAAAMPMPDAPWSNREATRSVEGAVARTVWQVPESGATPLQLLGPLRDTLEADGFSTVFDCSAPACGGFDFRFALDLLGPPEMFVDLANYRYLLARKGDEEVAIVTSRDAETGFVHVTALGAALPVAAPAPAAPEAGAPAPQPAAAIPTSDLGRTLVQTGSIPLDDVAFATGSSDLADPSAASLTALVAFLAERPDSRIALVGHTDAVGSLEANTALSKRRARAVAEGLVALGANPRQIEAEGAGYLAPRAPNTTPEGRARNRRVEAVLLDAE